MLKNKTDPNFKMSDKPGYTPKFTKRGWAYYREETEEIKQKKLENLEKMRIKK
jgi:hypothetical protein